MSINNNPIQYSSKSYITIYNDIQNVPSLRDKPEWFKRMIAGIGDMLSMYLDVQANQSFLRTAFTREAVQDLLSLIDYQIGVQSTSSGIIKFDLDADAVLPLAVPFNELTAISTETSGGQLPFRSRTDVVFTKIQFPVLSVSGDTLQLSSYAVTEQEFDTGDKVAFWNGIEGTLPSALSERTDYFIIPVHDGAGEIDPLHIKVASSRRNAFLGIAIANLDPDNTFASAILVQQLSQPVTCFQEEFKENIFVGRSDGITEWQQFNIPDPNILSVKARVAMNYWNEVDAFIESNSIDQAFKIVRKDNSLTAIEFGDGTYGAIPTINDIYVDYTMGGGSRSNISRLNIITQYTGGNTNITGCFNSTLMSGGSEEESLFNAKKYAPMLLRSQRRFVTTQDGEALVMNMGGISRVRITPNFFGPLTCLVQAVPVGGGFFTQDQITNIRDFLRSRSVLDIIAVTVIQPNYRQLDLLVKIDWNNGYDINIWKDIVWLALFLSFSERSFEFFTMFAQNGIDYTRQQLNLTFAKTFTAQMNGLMISLFRQATSPNFGVAITQSDIYFLLAVIPAVDNVDVWVFEHGVDPIPAVEGSPNAYINSLPWPIQFRRTEVDQEIIQIAQMVNVEFL